MMTSKRFSFALAVVVHILLLYALSKSGGHLLPSKEAGNPWSVTLILTPPSAVELPISTPHDIVSLETVKPIFPIVSAEPAEVRTYAPAVVESKDAVVPLPANAGHESLVQSALSAIGKMDRDEQRNTKGEARMTSNSLEARLSSALDKYAPVQAGTIDENVYPDGRREERIHTLGGVYCITFEAPSDPKDGFDTMQRGLKPSVPHTCGHRFD